MTRKYRAGQAGEVCAECSDGLEGRRVLTENETPLCGSLCASERRERRKATTTAERIAKLRARPKKETAPEPAAPPQPPPATSTPASNGGQPLKASYKGKEYEVLEAEGGYTFEGEHYKSLSAIGRKITGTSVNGPKFFGLR